MRSLLISAAILALAGAAQAQDASQKLSLTVYNSDLALVQDVRELSPPAGRSKLEFKDVSASIRPETATLNGRGLTVVEQNFDYDLLTPAKMMEKAVGKQVQIVRTNPGTGAQVTETATVLAVNDGVVLKVGDRIEVLRDDGVPTRVIFSSIPENLRANPTLSMVVDADKGGPREATLRYLTSGLSWRADYVAMFDQKRGVMDLQGWVTLTNKSGISYRDATTQLIAGDLNLVRSESEYFERAKQSGVGGGNGGPLSAAADYYTYPLPEAVTIADNQTKQVGFLALHDVPATKIYRYESRGFYSRNRPDHADVALQFSNSDALPSGVLRVYMRDPSGEPKFMGEDHVDHTPAASKLSIKTGQAFDVTVESTLVSSVRMSSTDTRQSMSYVVRNARSEPVTVQLIQGGVGRNGKIGSESLPSHRINADTLSWSVPVPARGETTLTFTADDGE
jgi:hypothetical protein